MMELDGKQLAREKMALMLSINKISEWIATCDKLLYRNLTDLLIPDVLRQVHKHIIGLHRLQRYVWSYSDSF